MGKSKEREDKEGNKRRLYWEVHCKGSFASTLNCLNGKALCLNKVGKEKVDGFIVKGKMITERGQLVIYGELHECVSLDRNNS